MLRKTRLRIEELERRAAVSKPAAGRAESAHARLDLVLARLERLESDVQKLRPQEKLTAHEVRFEALRQRMLAAHIKGSADLCTDYGAYVGYYPSWNRYPGRAVWKGTVIPTPWGYPALSRRTYGALIYVVKENGDIRGCFPSNLVRVAR